MQSKAKLGARYRKGSPPSIRCTSPPVPVQVTQVALGHESCRSSLEKQLLGGRLVGRKKKNSFPRTDSPKTATRWQRVPAGEPLPAQAQAHGRAPPLPAPTAAGTRAGHGRGSTRPLREEQRSKEGAGCDGPGVAAASTSRPARPPAPPELLRSTGSAGSTPPLRAGIPSSNSLFITRLYSTPCMGLKPSSVTFIATI